mmetsp:Transcript_18612/g.28107  ORF Transcript_18612/g.28107 Transcript_18612/m.28107 type:complete len:221 (+) Transcript_18612:25-687(+)
MMERNHMLHIFVFICTLLATRAFVPKGTQCHVVNKMTTSELCMMSVEQKPSQAYPVISRIAGINWTGSCRYVGADLVPLSKIKLTGGIRYDINGTDLTLSSFLTFPNGNTREVMMKGNRNTESASPVITLHSVEEGGPIRMHLTELGPDTVLIKEVEETTGKIILTASLSITRSPKGVELVQVSHEVGQGLQSIEGHQVWRLTAAPVAFKDFDYRDATGI